MIWLLGALGTARRALAWVADFVRRNPLAALLTLSVALSVWFWHGRSTARDERDGARAQVVALKAANVAATKLAIAEKRAKETAANDIKESANDSRKVAQAAGARAGDDYAARNRCVRTPASGRVNANLPRPDSVAGQPAEQADVAELVGVTRPDFNQCSVNSLDLANAVQWADDMRAKGLAK